MKTYKGHGNHFPKPLPQSEGEALYIVERLVLRVRYKMNYIAHKYKALKWEAAEMGQKMALGPLVCPKLKESLCTHPYHSLEGLSEQYETFPMIGLNLKIQ